MQIYLPIAELSLNVFLLLGIGGAIGFLSGMFGVGGGFLLTPLLIFIGVPPAVAVATQANQVVASSVSGVLAHWSRNNVDFKMGVVLLLGGIVGSTLGWGMIRKILRYVRSCKISGIRARSNRRSRARKSPRMAPIELPAMSAGCRPAASSSA